MLRLLLVYIVCGCFCSCLLYSTASGDLSKMVARHRERRQNKGELIEGPVERGCWCACGFVIYFRWVRAFALLALFVDGLNRISKSYFYGLECSSVLG